MLFVLSERSERIFKRAKELIPGGVNSPVRAFGAVGGIPRMIAKAKGSRIFDVDGNEYIDFIGSWGPMILGHNYQPILDAVINTAQNGLSFGAATAIEVEMAELICSLVPSIDMVRMVNSGTEAVMSAVRAARGFTGRDKIIKFDGCYHGHSDAMLVKAGSGVMTSGVPDSAGVPKGCAEDTLTATYNNLESVQRLFEQHHNQIAAVIIEPVAANMGVVTPVDGFLQGLRRLCDEHGSLLIFDEVITGFRLGLTGAQGLYRVTPDLTTFGKIVGAGMPVGAYGGRREIMQMIAPVGKVYQAGTLSGNPVAMAAGICQLKILKEAPEIYQHMNQLGDRLRKGLQTVVKGGQVTGIGSLSCLFFTDTLVTDGTTAKQSDTAAFAKYFNYMLENGCYFAPSQFEAIFLSNAHTQADVDCVLNLAEQYFKS